MATKKPAAKKAPAKKAPARRATPAPVEAVNLFEPEPSRLQLKAKRLSPEAQLPVYATPGAACFDLHAINTAVILPGEAQVFGTGLAFEVPEGHVMLVYSRSGLGFNSGIRLANSVAVIDADFRGGVMLKLHNDSDVMFKVYKGDRIAQAMLVPIPAVEIVEAEELSETQRGEGGFGSSGR